MATIKIKRRATGGASGAPGALAAGEPAYSEVDSILYIGTTGSTVVAMGGQGAFCTLTSTQTISGGKTFSGSVDLGSSAIASTQLATDNSTKVATTAFVKSIGYLTTANKLNDLAAATGNYAMGNNKITGLATPTADTDAANKGYVDAARAGLDVKNSCRAATTANVATLAGGAPNTVDGVSLALNDRVLVKNQTTGSQNGIYAVTTLGTGSNGTWTRATDADADAEVHAGLFTFVTEGSTLADTGWVLTTNDPITVGTTALAFAQFSGGGVPGGYTGQTTITTLGIITTGTWNASIVTVPYGGTGVATLTGLAKGNGTSAFTAAVVEAGTGTGDYLGPNSPIDGGVY